MSGKFVLIASYPKSGNTWVRIVLERAIRGPSFPINGLADSFHGLASRMMFDEFAPANASDLLEDEIENFQPGVYRSFLATIDGVAFVKVHERAKRTKLGDWLFPPDIVHAAIYLVRHPFDVAVSAAEHFGLDMDKAIDLLCNDDSLARAHTRLPEPLPQYYGSWRENVVSWLDDAPYRKTVVRYEDLHAAPLDAFLRIARGIGMAIDADAMQRVVEASKFDRLQQEERQSGFRERPANTQAFFRQGRVRGWEEILDPSARERIVREHGHIMERLGYRADGDVVPYAEWQAGASRAADAMS